MGELQPSAIEYPHGSCHGMKRTRGESPYPILPPVDWVNNQVSADQLESIERRLRGCDAPTPPTDGGEDR